MNPVPNRTLKLASYEEIDIDNRIWPDPAPNYVARSRREHPLIWAAAKSVAPATGRYNCHGLVFAARRTSIDSTDPERPLDIEALLRQDRYRRVVVPQEGDVVVYRDLSDGQIEHTGLVIEVARPSGEASSSMVKVLSAWGHAGTFTHALSSVPYNGAPEYWGLR